MNRTVPLILAVALFMENMDSTVIATSLPAIARDIGTSPIALKLALTAYLVSLAIFIPLSGWMADRFGAKRVFRIAIGVFIVGSVACAAADSLGTFVAARFLQGMGGAMMTPVGRLVLVRSTPRSDLVSAMAWLTVPALIGPLVGPPVGGFITTYASWHWIFLINVPIGILGIVLAGRFLPPMPGIAGTPPDVRGLVLSGLAASGLVFGLSVISLPALPPAVGVASVVVGILSAFAYVAHARSTPSPVLDLRMLAIPSLRASVTGGSLFRIGVGAVPFLLPLMFQVGFGLTPFQSGMMTFASAIGAIGMKFFVRRLLRLAGFRVLLVAGSVIGGVMIAINGLFTPETPYGLIIITLVIAGFLRSLVFTSINALTFAEVDNSQTAQATAISAVMQQVTIAIGVAVAGLILETMVRLTGGELTLQAFHVAFFGVGLLSALAAIPFLLLDNRVGSAISGHRLRAEEESRDRSAP